MNRLEKHIKISRLLWKQLNDELSGQEEKELDLLFEENPKFKKWFSLFKKEKHIDTRLEEYYAIDIQEKWNEFYPRIKKENRIRTYSRFFLRAAAVIVLLLAVYFIVSEIRNDFDWQLAKSEILPGSSKAILTLSDGSKIKLQEKTIDTVYDVGNQIKSTGELLIYSKKEEIANLSKPEINKVEVPRGGEFHVELNDGTKVWLNSETSIKYQVPFGTKNRLIELNGEAYFEVAHNKELPFIVKHQEVSVTALGTAFNVRTYTNEPYITTTLVEGKVLFENNNDNKLILSPGKQATFDKETHVFNVDDVDVKRFLVWRNGEFMFVDDRLEDIINDLARWYDFEVFYETEAIKDIRFTFYLNKNIGINKILQLLEKTERLRFDISEKYVLIKKYPR